MPPAATAAAAAVEDTLPSVEGLPEDVLPGLGGLALLGASLTGLTLPL